MSQRGLEAYVVGDQIRPPTHPQAVDDMTVEEPNDGNDATQPVDNHPQEQVTDGEEVRQVTMEELRVPPTTAAADHVNRPLTVTELRTSQRADVKLQPLIRFLEQDQREEAVKSVKMELIQQIGEPLRAGTNDYVLNEQGLLIHVERTDTTVRRYFRQQVVVPEELQERVLHWHHGSSVTAHQGVSRTYQAIREHYYWQGLRRDVYRYVMACKCQGLKVKKPVAAGDDGHLESAWPNDLVVVDCAGPLPETSQGNKYLVLIQDHFTKFAEVACVPAITARMISQVLLNRWIWRYGPMRRLLSDNGPEFDNELLVKGLCDMCGVQKIFTTPYHPQSNGMAERLVRTVKTLLTARMETTPGEWDERVATIVFAYNNTIHSDTGEVPFYLWFGRPPVAISSLLASPVDLPTTDSTQTYREELWRRLAMAFELVREQQHALTTRHVNRAVQEQWQPGDLAWLYRPSLTNSLNSRKMVNPWDGPGQVLRVETPTRIHILLPTRRDPRRTFVVHPDRLRRYQVPFQQVWQQSGQPYRFPLTLISKRIVTNGNISKY